MTMTQSESQINRLPLHDIHKQEGARFIQFAGWEVPVYFTSIIDEHLCVRQNCGLFDISHMGEFRVHGSGSKNFLDFLVTNKVHSLVPNRAVYSPMLNEKGGIIDDLIIYEMTDENFLIIVNASNIDKDFTWMKSKAPQGVQVENISNQRGILAVQGPNSRKVIESVFGSEIAKIPLFSFVCVPFQGEQVVVSATGYTGEEGFELFFDRKLSRDLYQELKKAGKFTGMKSIGFGARDTLRLEARLLLHGHDMNETITPLEAGLGWTVDFEKKDFIGKKVLEEQKQKGVSRKLVGFEMIDRAPAREHYKIAVAGKEIGEVTSGTVSPTLNKSIGLAMISSEFAKENSEIEVIVRGKSQKAKIVKTPFYKRK